MSIFKKASVMPIVKTVISQGLEDYSPEEDQLNDDIEDRDGLFNSGEDKVSQMFKNLYKSGNDRQALLVAKFYFDGFDYEQIRDQLRALNWL
jgi:hypothetical protein